jgi:hypothetical protein
MRERRKLLLGIEGTVLVGDEFRAVKAKIVGCTMQPHLQLLWH